MRPIDADAFDARLVRLGALSIKSALDEEPTIDPVHAAGGCYCWECMNGEERENRHGITGFRCNLFCADVDPGEFCSHGRRREDKMIELKPCPFCGGDAEIHRRRTSRSFYADSKQSIPKNGTLERTIERPNGETRYEYRKAEWVPRCLDSSCPGRLGRMFPSPEEAAAAWNRREGGK